jgi:hypothetical protein
MSASPHETEVQARASRSRVRSSLGFALLGLLLFGPMAGALWLGLSWGRAWQAAHWLAIRGMEQLTGDWSDVARQVFAWGASILWIGLYAFVRERWVLAFAAVYVVTQIFLGLAVVMIGPQQP